VGGAVRHRSSLKRMDCGLLDFFPRRRCRPSDVTIRSHFGRYEKAKRNTKHGKSQHPVRDSPTF